MQIIKKDTLIITNVKSFYDNLQKLDEFKNRSYYFENFNDLTDFVCSLPHNNYIIFFDEIFTALEKKGTLNKKSLSFISQLRKRGVILVTTAQEWSEINITFRRYCRFQIDCNMITIPIFKYAICINTIKDGDQIKWDNDLQDFIAPTLETNVHKGLRKIIDLYDTFETINMSQSMNSGRSRVAAATAYT